MQANFSLLQRAMRGGGGVVGWRVGVVVVVVVVLVLVVVVVVVGAAVAGPAWSGHQGD